MGALPEEQGQPAAVVVNVTGLRYAWLFSYPGTDVTAGELHVPVNQDVELNISANDVIHAFWVPEFRLKQDAIPGRQGYMRFTHRVPREYSVICAELCGPYHGAMKTRVIVQTPEDYQAWMQEQIASVDSGSQTVAVNPAEHNPPQSFGTLRCRDGSSTPGVASLVQGEHPMTGGKAGKLIEQLAPHLH